MRTFFTKALQICDNFMVYLEEIRIDSVRMKIETSTAIKKRTTRVGAASNRIACFTALPFWRNKNQVILNWVAATVSLIFVDAPNGKAFSNQGNGVYVSDGSVSDTQNALNSVPAGSTVQIPNGNYTWSSTVTVNTGVSLQGQSVGGVTITDNAGASPVIQIVKSANQITTLSNLTIQPGNQTYHHLGIYGTYGLQPVLIHDCVFNTDGNEGAITWQSNGGVIWNCTFNCSNLNFDGGGIQLKNSDTSDPSWSTPDTMGVADSNGSRNTYIEDCTFNYLIDQCLDFDDNSRTVVRHCTFNNSGCTSHGADTSPIGNRHCEIYNNSFIFTQSGGSFPLNINYFVLLRGGTAVFFNNVIPAITSETWGQKAGILFGDFNISLVPNSVPCQTQYPSFHQLGQGWNNGQVSDPVYLWGNSGGGDYDNPGLDQFSPDACGSNQQVSNYIQAGRDYFTGTARPGYTPYTYPHPLRSGSQQSLLAQPVPTPTPQAPPPPTGLHVVS